MDKNDQEISNYLTARDKSLLVEMTGCIQQLYVLIGTSESFQKIFNT